jgi:glycosyltransferase involved in cell wall biosynthesis
VAVFQKILNKSNSYKFYKKGYENLKGIEKDLKKKQVEIDSLNNDLKKKQVEIDSLNKDYDNIKKDRDDLFNKYLSDYLFFDFEGILSKFYVSPLIKSPFTVYDKRCFAFMDHLAKYLKKSIDDNNQPLVSIILPVFNNESELSKTIESVLNQSYDNYELIIVDDASEDKTSTLLNSIEESNVQIFINDERKGISFCRNFALNKANGEYIFYIDIGNEWCEEYLKTMMGAFLELSDAEAIYSGQLIYDHDWNKVSGIMFGTYNKSLLYNRNYISLSAFAHKKSLIYEIQFEESLYTLEDWHFILNVSKNHKMYSIPVLQSKTNFESHDDEKDIEVIHKLIDNKKDFSVKYELNKKISIVIPSYELLDDLKENIDTILSFNSPLVDIIVVDNNSNDEVKEYLNAMHSEGKINLIQNDINYGFTYAVEQGISISDSNSDILLLNNDAILTKGALEAMQYHAYNIEDCGIIVPQEILFNKDSRIKYNVPYANFHYECDVTPSMAHYNIIGGSLFHDGEILELNFAPFFCTYIKREIYNSSLGLDPELGRHYRSDRIFSNFVRHVLQLKIYHTSDATVYHKFQKATNKLKKNKDEFNVMFTRNQWEPELAERLGYKTPLWDKD